MSAWRDRQIPETGGPAREAGTRAPVSRTPSDHDFATEKLMQSEQVEGVRAGSVRNSIPSSFNRYEPRTYMRL